MRKTTTDKVMLGAMIVSVLAAVAGCSSEEQGTEIGPRGGIIASQDGRFSLEIPAGALEQDVELTIAEVDCQRDDAVDACFEVGPVGLPLLRPAKVTYAVDEDMLADHPGEEFNLLVEREEKWNQLADRSVDPHSISGSAVYLSSYALVATP